MRLRSPVIVILTLGLALSVVKRLNLISERAVFVIVGRSSNQLIPLADVIDFRLYNREVAVRLDDAKHESKFAVKEMVLRSEWDRIQRHIDEQLRSTELEEARR